MAANLIDIAYDEEFDIILKESSRLIVVDFYATWCPPCQQIAPFIHQLAVQYPDITFLKVDVDRLQKTAQSRGVRAMPTFHFYLNNSLLTQSQGANPQALQSQIEQLSHFSPSSATTTEKKEEYVIKSEYFFFPQRKYTLFDGVKNLPNIKKKIATENSNVGDNHKLSKEDLSKFSQLIDTLSDTSFYHASKFDQSEYNVLLKLIQWPNDKNFPALDVLRLLILHPHAAAHYIASYEHNKDDNLIAIAVSYLMEELPTDTNYYMIWRFFTNLFKEEKARTVLLEIFDQLYEIAERFASHQNVQVRLAVVSVLFNYSIQFVRLKKDERKSNLVKVLLKTVIETETHPEIIYRALLALGTTCFEEPDLIDLVTPTLSLKLPNIIKIFQSSSSSFTSSLVPELSKFFSITISE